MRAGRGASLAALALALALALPPSRAGAQPASYRGRILDGPTGRPIADAVVTVGGAVARTGPDGAFHLSGEGPTLGARAVGYRRVALPAEDLRGKAVELRLPAFGPKGLYLSVYGIGDRGIRNAALQLVRETDLNALVIDMKGDKGLIPCKVPVALAAETGAQAVTTVRDMPALVRRLHGEGIYLIARIVTFKDTPLALARPQWAVRTAAGKIWRDREDLAWIDPFQREAWTYAIDVAVEAARLGFDEIQFDYIRFPDAKGLVFSRPSTEEDRVRTIGEFLAAARRALAPHNVFVSADIFGYVLWNRNDTDIGQKLEAIEKDVDYLCPMLYPTTFQYGIPGYKIPVKDPRAIVLRSLRNGSERAKIPPARFRPWLQAFRDYAFDKRRFGGDEVRAQIRAAREAGALGWMLWNPVNHYEADGLPGGHPFGVPAHDDD